MYLFSLACLFYYATSLLFRVNVSNGKECSPIQIVSKKIILSPSYINLFTLSKWDKDTKILYTHIQRERPIGSKAPSFYLQLVKKFPLR